MNKYDVLEMDGICGVNEPIQPGQIFINKQTPNNTSNTLQDLSSDLGYFPILRCLLAREQSLKI